MVKTSKAKKTVKSPGTAAKKTVNKASEKSIKKVTAKSTTKAQSKSPVQPKGPSLAVATGHTVSVDYIGTLSNGEEFDNSKTHGPISFEVGKGQVIKGFDNAVIGMKVNDNKKFTIKKEEAYGDINPKMVHKVPLDKLPEDIKSQVKIGGFLVLQSPTGHQIPAKVTAMDSKEATLDMNHPLAGKDLTFDITIKDISTAPKNSAKDKEECDCKDNCCGSDCCK